MRIVGVQLFATTSDVDFSLKQNYFSAHVCSYFQFSMDLQKILAKKLIIEILSVQFANLF